MAGLDLDPWQQFILSRALGEGADGKWAAFEVGIVVPRQNGKGSILEARELAGLFLFGEKLLIHSAHEQATSSEHFRRLLDLIEGVPEFERRVLKAPKGKGAEAIELRGGQRIFFKTRTGGGGRGLTGDLVVLDEAMILPAAATAALVPTMAANSVRGNPQLWYAGSAVDEEKHEHGVVLARVRERGMKQAPRLAFFEFAVPGDDPNSVAADIRDAPAMWARANPGMGIRISEQHIANECGGALGPREFAVERLGVGDWPRTDAEVSAVIPLEVWLSKVDPMSKPQNPLVFTFDVTPDRSYAAIGLAGRREDGRQHVEIIEHRPGTGWLVERLKDLVDNHDGEIVADGTGPAAALMNKLSDAELDVRWVTAKEHAQACGAFYDAVVEDMMRHRGSPMLLAALKGAAKRPLAEAWAWSRTSSLVDISPLVAVTLALWASESAATSDEPLVAFV